MPKLPVRFSPVSPSRGAVRGGLWYLIPLVVLASLMLWAACGDDNGDGDGNGGTTPAEDGTVQPTEDGDANGADTPEDNGGATAGPTPEGELSLSFLAGCDAGNGAPEMSVGVEASATDEAFIDRVRVFVDGVQAFEETANSVQQFEETLTFRSTPGEHTVRVSVDGGGRELVTLPMEAQPVTCPGQAQDGE